MTKEEIYDEQINPLMAQIINICKVNKIAMIADFALDAVDFRIRAMPIRSAVRMIADFALDAVDFHCTSATLADEYEPLPNQMIAWDCLNPKSPSFVALAETTETRPDGSKHITIRKIL